MNTFRIKRRLAGGAAGAPVTLVNAELAYNEQDDILYYGKGISTGINAAAVIAIGGSGATVWLSGDQSIAGIKTFTSSPLVPTPAGADNSTKAATTAWTRTYAQATSAALTAFAAMVTVGMLVQTASGAYSARSLTGTAGRITVVNGDGAAGAPTFDLATTGVIAGAYTKPSFDVYGRATNASGNLGSSDVITALGFTPVDVATKGAVNGIASLGADGKVPVGQLPSTVTGGMNYQGIWNAATNTPILANGVGTKGFFYKVAIAGNTTIDGNTGWTVGDIIAYNGTTWDKMEGGAPDVVSVAGRIGAVVLAYADIAGLGTMAQQGAAAVVITGGSIDNIIIDGGTF